MKPTFFYVGILVYKTAAFGAENPKDDPMTSNVSLFGEFYGLGE